MTQESPALPRRTDVAVIGGGIVGVCTAWFLARRGVACALIEKGRIAGEQSSRNWGFVRQQGRAPQELPLAMEALRIWQGLGREIGEETGFRCRGIVYASEDEDRLREFEDFRALARLHQLDTRLLTPAQLGRLLPDMRGGWKGGLHTPSDGRAEPRLATPAIARAAARAGAVIVTGCAARGLDRKTGRVAGVVTERGLIEASSVVLAGGIWSSLFAGNHGIDLPQLRVQNNVFRTTPAPEVLAGAVWADDVALRRRQDGGFTVAHGRRMDVHLAPDLLRRFWEFQPAWRQERDAIRLRFGRQSLREIVTRRRWALDDTTPFEAVRVMDPRPYRGVVMETFGHLRRRFPALSGAGIAASWAGLIDVTPDAIPVISPVEGIPGFYISTGYSGHGFGIGPAAGLATAELATGAPASFDLSAFRLSRFAEGAPNPFGGAA